MEENAIVVSHVSKDFRLPHERAGSIKSLFTGIFKKRNKGMSVQHALHDISFEIKKGEFFGIVGRNGSGKSTMLKMLAGIYQPTSGSLHVAGKLVPFIELGVGFNPELTGKQNVYLNGALLGFSEKEIDEQYKDIVDFAELHDFMDQKLKNYSSGMQVRLAFSMAVRAKADVLLIDEVLAVGDADFQRKCFNYFKNLKKENTTVIFVSHNMDAVREYCDRALLIEKSKVILSGETSKVADSYSQLFTDSNGSDMPVADASDPNSRKGTGAVRATSLKGKTVYNDKDINIEISVMLEGFKNNKELMVGYRLTNSTGQIVQDTNTWNEKIKLPELKPGETCEVNFEFANIYADGRYYLDIYVHGDGNEIYDVWDNALIFEERRLRHSGAILSPPNKVAVHV